MFGPSGVLSIAAVDLADEMLGSQSDMTGNAMDLDATHLIAHPSNRALCRSIARVVQVDDVSNAYSGVLRAASSGWLTDPSLVQPLAPESWFLIHAGRTAPLSLKYLSDDEVPTVSTRDYISASRLGWSSQAKLGVSIGYHDPRSIVFVKGS